MILQEDYTPEDADEAASVGGDRKSFFAPADGASFHANSFLELNLSRPLLRACEALGYTKPTPIQVFIAPIFQSCILILQLLNSRVLFVGSLHTNSFNWARYLWERHYWLWQGMLCVLGACVIDSIMYYYENELILLMGKLKN